MAAKSLAEGALKAASGLPPHNKIMAGIAGLITKFTQKEVDQLFKKSHRIFHSGAATILAAPRDKDYSRLLIIASKKTGAATERNLIRRRLKSIFYQEKLFNTLKFDLVFIAKKPIITLQFTQLKELFLSAVKAII